LDAKISTKARKVLSWKIFLGECLKNHGETNTSDNVFDTFSRPSEIGARIGHNHMVDYWALGVLIFELMSGLAPFYG
jgi:hypothetical protein